MTDQQRRAEEEVARELKKIVEDIEYSLGEKLTELSTTDHLLRWSRACEALAIRYRMALDKIAEIASNITNDDSRYEAGDALKRILSLAKEEK